MVLLNAKELEATFHIYKPQFHFKTSISFPFLGPKISAKEKEKHKPIVLRLFEAYLYTIIKVNVQYMPKTI